MSAPYDPEHITYFAETDYRNQRTRFGIKSRDRTRHMYVIGKSGVGKSTLLENMAIQDIQNGEGLAVLDPHGSFAEKMLDYVPEHRIKDVIYFAPFDTENPVSFNVLEDVGPEKRHLVVSGLMSTFKKIWVDAWSARMEYILSNTLLALLEYPDSTLLGVNRMLSDKDFRKKVVDNISDAAVKAFWTEEFAKYTERMAAEAVPAIQNKIGQLTANPLIRNVIGQPKSSFDIRSVMDTQKILIINLSKGRIGEQNTALLGSMIITKIYLGAMSRADASPKRMSELPNFYFYVDEFQSFANETFANILSEARKYKLALIIAHQYVAQMEESVRDAVFGNVGTSISFRVGPLVAELLEKAFAPQFSQNDLINLGMAQVYLSLLINDMGSPPFSARTLPPIPRPTITYRNDVIEWSRATYAAPRATVEQVTKDWYALDAAPPKEDRPKKEFRPGGEYQGGNKPFYPQQQATQQSASSPFRPQQPLPQSAPQNDHSYNRPQQTSYDAPYQKHQAPATIQQTHQPFKKVLEPIAQRIEPSHSPSSIPEDISETPSPALEALLSTLSFEKKEPTTLEKVPQRPMQQANSFIPKPVFNTQPKQVVPPVKLAERGPSDKNRDLLKMALKQAIATSTPHHGTTEPISPASNTAPVQPLQVTPPTKGEISHQDLRKVLE